MIQVRRLGHATFSTPDVERQVAYYADVLGLQVIARDKDRVYLATHTGLEAIALERGDAVALKRLSFQVAPDSDLAALGRALDAHGIASERRSGISPGIADAISFTDIKGTQIDLFVDYAFADDDRKPAVITPLKLGHVAYRVTDVQAVTKFYTDVLGFRVSDWRDTTFSFLRCNTDHHTVNFVVDPVAQLHHSAFEVKDWPEIHRASDFLARNGIQLVWGPARHIIGHNIAAYHRNADNVRVEFYCEMDQMKDEALGYFDPRPWHQDRPQRPKVWPKDTMRNYWGFASHGTFPGYP